MHGDRQEIPVRFEFAFDYYPDARNFTNQLTALGIAAQDESYRLDGMHGLVSVPGSTSEQLMRQAREHFNRIPPKGYGR